ncbi:MAG: glycoside hydrolase family 127 protein [Bacteroidota bacterium]
MKYSLTLLLSILLSALSAQQYPIQPISFHQVKMEDKFWKPRIETVCSVTVPATYKKNEETLRIKNFDVASGTVPGNVCTRFPFDDSDVYKSIEGAANALRIKRDPALEAQTDALIEKIKAAQEPDGYIYTWRTISERVRKSGSAEKPVVEGAYLDWLKGPRWQNEDKHSHELYCAGHLYEAAVAYFEATGKRTLLDVALKNAELLAKDFGPGKLRVAPGHQEIEIGLIRLYRNTGDKRWLDLARFFIDARGYGDEYAQNHKPVKDQRTAAGHAVRLCYMFMATADLAAYTGTHEYDDAMRAVWEDIVGSQMYLTGGVGATGSNEGFGGSFDLPNYTAYNETCSSIAFVLWSQRMFQLTGDSRYLDVVELTLYNALNAGLSLSGDHYFYPNPLESRKNTERTDWFSCACCPPNLTRFFTSMPSLFYARSGNDLYINQFGNSSTEIQNINSKGQQVNVKIRQESNFPWSGLVKIRVEPAIPNTFTLRVHIPGWAKGDVVPLDLYHFREESESPVVFRLNGSLIIPSFEKGFAVFNRKWMPGDVLEADMPMRPKRVLANSRVEADQGRFAVRFGPMIYCLEGKDQSDDRVLNLFVPDTAVIRPVFNPALFGGIQTMQFRGFLVSKKISPEKADLQPLALKAIPYFMWNNRGADNMTVWIPEELRHARALAQPTLASRSKVEASEGCKGDPVLVTDQMPVKNSADHESSFIHWWPEFGSAEWIQYSFPGEEQVGTARIYFFDDESAGGGCRVPAKWEIKYLENGVWRPVYVPAGYSTTKDGWTEVQFEPVKTTALRLEMTFKEGVSGGVHEWEVY